MLLTEPFEELTMLFVRDGNSIVGWFYHPNPKAIEKKKKDVRRELGPRVTFETRRYLLCPKIGNPN